MERIELRHFRISNYCYLTYEVEVLERADVIYKMAKTIFINVLVDMSVEFR